jgi:hypothetical protein
MKRKHWIINGLATCALALSYSSVASLHIDATNYNKQNNSTSSRIGQLKETRSADSWALLDNTSVTANIDDNTSISLSNTNVSLSTGNLTLAFDPQQLHCTNGFNISFSLGDSIATSVRPNCDALINAEINDSFTHDFDLPRFTAPPIPVDPWGIVKVNIGAGPTASLGMEWSAGLTFDYSHFKDGVVPFAHGATARPLTVYGTIKPWSKAGLDASATFSVGWWICSVAEGGIRGNLTLLDAGVDARVEAGIAKKYNADKDKWFIHGFARANATAWANTGAGSINVYAKIMKRVQVWIFVLEHVFWEGSHDIIKWPSLFDYSQAWDTGYQYSKWKL